MTSRAQPTGSREPTRRTPRRPTAAAGASAAVVLLLAGCGGSSPGPGGSRTATGPPADQRVTLTGTPRLMFDARTLHARPGRLTVTLRIAGGVAHDLIWQDGRFPAIATVPTGGAGSSTFTVTPGTYQFECDIHSGMTGQLVVS